MCYEGILNSASCSSLVLSLNLSDCQDTSAGTAKHRAAQGIFLVAAGPLTYLI